MRQMQDKDGSRLKDLIYAIPFSRQVGEKEKTLPTNWKVFFCVLLAMDVTPQIETRWKVMGNL